MIQLLPALVILAATAAASAGGHTRPGGAPYLPRFIIGRTSRQLDASQTIVEFFLAHPMR